MARTYWTCTNCNDKVEDVYDVCWNCQYDREGNLRVEITEGVTTGDLSERQRLSEKYQDQHCAVCRTRLTYLGTKQFHEGPQLGTLDELFKNSVVLEMYLCPQCRRVEFFQF